ncbi:small integral membrane protein 35-like [Cetorhinus maximus]
MANPHEDRATVTPSSEILLHIQRQVTSVNNTEPGDSNSVNTRGIIIAVCLLTLAVVVLIIFLVQYYRHGCCFQKPKLTFSQNVLRDLKSIQLEFDPPFTISGMMNALGNPRSDQQFQYHNMEICDEDLYPAIAEHH